MSASVKDHFKMEGEVMYTAETTFTISAAHRLALDYESPCSNWHGHNWKITVICKSETLDQNGMVLDFKKIKTLVRNKLDHSNINDYMPDNPTAENIARWICELIGPICKIVKVQETEGNVAIYER